MDYSWIKSLTDGIIEKLNKEITADNSELESILNRNMASKMMHLMTVRDTALINSRSGFIRMSMIVLSAAALSYYCLSGDYIVLSMVLIFAAYTGYALIYFRDIRDRRFDDFNSKYFSDSSESTHIEDIADKNTSAQNASCPVS